MLQSKFQDRQKGYTERSCFEKHTINNDNDDDDDVKAGSKKTEWRKPVFSTKTSFSKIKK